MEALELLQGVALFDGLSEGELRRVAGICRPATFHKGDEVTRQGGDGSQMFLVREGLLEVTVGEAPQGGSPAHTLVSLGAGQVVGEMSLVDHGPRSATVRCVTEACDVLIIERQAFEELCQAEHHIGLVVYRNLAADLSFKLRHQHLARR